MVNGKEKRRCPSTPPGLEPKLKLENTYDKEKHIGHFIAMLNSKEFKSQTVAKHGEVAQQQPIHLPLFGNIDTTLPEFRGAISTQPELRKMSRSWRSITFVEN